MYTTEPAKEYKKLLKNSKNQQCNREKKKMEKYYAIVNVVTEVEELKKTGENIGIDLGLKTLVTLSNTQEIANLDLSQEEAMIKKYQKKLSRKKSLSEQIFKQAGIFYAEGIHYSIFNIQPKVID